MKINILGNLWKCLTSSYSKCENYLDERHDRALDLDKQNYKDKVTIEAVDKFNFIVDNGVHYGTFNGVVITLGEDEESLLNRITELRRIYVERKMKEYGKD